jgi:hypothetical protein
VLRQQELVDNADTPYATLQGAQFDSR